MLNNIVRKNNILSFTFAAQNIEINKSSPCFHINNASSDYVCSIFNNLSIINNMKLIIFIAVVIMLLTKFCNYYSNFGNRVYKLDRHKSKYHEHSENSTSLQRAPGKILITINTFTLCNNRKQS